MRQRLQNWFGIKEMFFFKYCKGKLVGQALGEEQYELIQDLNIPFKENGSLLVRSLIQGQILDSFSQNKDKPLSILDQQLIRLLQGKGLLSLPLTLEGDYLGVLVFGCTRTECEQIKSRQELLLLFLNQARFALHMHHEREVQQMRIRDERLSASSAVIRRIVHEVHNPLGIINNYLSILGSKLGEEKQVQDSLLIIKEEIQRISVLLNELSGFSSSPAQGAEPTDVNHLISDMIKISQESFWKKAKIRVQCILDPNLPTIHSEPSKLKQILINLIKNAVEAMSEGGSIHIETMRSDVEEDIEIQVRDSGPGIPADLQPQIFEPFISTKGHEGLGLSIVYNNVKELGGSISFESNSQSGTSFSITLPIKRD
jgi:signal transduction histidine kinase